MRRRGYTACGGACFRGAGPVPWHRHRRAVVPSHGLVAGDERRRTSRGRHSAPRAPQESGATIPGTPRRPGQTDTRARGSTDHRPPTRHPPPTIGYQSPTPFSSFRVPQGGINDCSENPARNWPDGAIIPPNPHEAPGVHCLRGGVLPWCRTRSMAQTSARRSTVTRTGRRRRASEDVARETFCSTCSPRVGGNNSGYAATSGPD